MYRVNTETSSGQRKAYSLSSIRDISLLLEEKERNKIDGEKMSTKNTTKTEYRYTYDNNRLPIDKPFESLSTSNIKVYKEGFTNDLRKYWNELDIHSISYERMEDEMKALNLKVIGHSIVQNKIEYKKSEEKKRPKRKADINRVF